MELIARLGLREGVVLSSDDGGSQKRDDREELHCLRVDSVPIGLSPVC